MSEENALTSAGGSIISSVIGAAVSVYQTERTISENRERDQKQRQFQKELEELRYSNQQQLDKESFVRQKLLQEELAAYNRQTQLQIAAEQRQTALESVEAKKLFENWPLRIVPSLILNSHRGDGPLPLRIIPVPPVVDFDQFTTNAKEFPPIEKYLAEGLRQFLHQNYSLNHKIRPVELLDGAWDSNRYHGASSIKALFSMLQSEPILILESEIDGDYLNFRLGYWGLGQENYSYAPVISRLPFRDIIYESAKTRALAWKTSRDKIVALGQDPKIINELDTYNLEILELEATLKEAGIDTSNLPRRYRVSNQDFEAFAQFLVTCNRLVAGWIADVHHLIQNNVTPLLPQLLPELAGETLEEVVQTILTGYGTIYQSLEGERLEVMPELLLDFAKSLNSLPDKSWARSQVNNSVKSWLKLRGVILKEERDIVKEMQPLLMSSEDLAYVHNLGECLTVIGDQSTVKEVKGLLRAMETTLNNAETYYQSAVDFANKGDYQGAITAIDQAIRLKPNDSKFQDFRNQLEAKNYYQSAVDLAHKGDYQSAITAIDQAIGLKPNDSKFQDFRQRLPKSVGSYQFDVITVNSRGEETQRKKSEAQYFREELPKGVSLDMVAIPGGTFIMGSPEGEGRDSEKPQHQVTVQSFFMGKYPLTQAQWKAIASRQDLKVERDLETNPSNFKGDSRPVEKVSWYDAVEFCDRLSKLTGREYRLPSEAEWEYGCRADPPKSPLKRGTSDSSLDKGSKGTSDSPLDKGSKGTSDSPTFQGGARGGFPFHFGETLTTDLANYDGNYTYADAQKGVYRKETTPVGMFPPNAFGLYDMHGNVWEWCEDDWHRNYQGAPNDGSAWITENINICVLRGGSWCNIPGFCRSATRYFGTRAYNDYYVGFRVVCVLLKTH